MSEPTSAELTTRDVLVQIDRRLELSEGDVRRLDAKIDDVEARLTARIDGLETKLDLKIELLRKEMNTRFYWLIGLMFATWVSTMGTILIRT